MRLVDARRQKGNRGGLRIIYYYWCQGSQFWLMTVYGKDVRDDLTAHQKGVLKQLLSAEIQARTTS